MYTPAEIKGFYSAWRNLYNTNDDNADSCQRFSMGAQWDDQARSERALRGEETYTFPVIQNILAHVKGAADSLELGLRVTSNPDKTDPNLLREGREILEKIVLCNDHLSAFRHVFHQVYDWGYGALLLTTDQYKEGEPSKIPFLTPIKDLRRCFWDPSCLDDFKTKGRFCGIRYSMSGKELGVKDCSDEDHEVIDFWYREKTYVEWYFSKSRKWTNVKPDEGFLVKNLIPKHSVKFMRIIDDKVQEGPIDYYGMSSLPLIYWKGFETHIREGDNLKPMTLPFISNLIHIQSTVNYLGSSIVSRVKKMGSTKVVLTQDMIAGREKDWEDYNRASGVLLVNSSDDGNIQQPIVLNGEQLDPTLINALTTFLQMMDAVSGITEASQGTQGAPTGSGLRAQVIQSSVMHAVVRNNHMSAINEVGRLLKQMTPQVIIEERDIGGGFFVNKPGELSTPSSPDIINDISELFSKLDFEICCGASSEAERFANLNALKDILSTNQGLFQYFGDAYTDSLNSPNRLDLKRRMMALMPPGIKEVGEGTMTIDEYRQLQQQQEQQSQQPNPDQQMKQQALELQKQKVVGDQQLRQEELELKKAKLQEQSAKDAHNIQIKAATAASKLEHGKGKAS